MEIKYILSTKIAARNGHNTILDVSDFDLMLTHSSVKNL